MIIEETDYQVGDTVQVARGSWFTILDTRGRVGNPDLIIIGDGDEWSVCVDRKLITGHIRKSDTYKIQLCAVGGWADVKESVDEGPYEISTYSNVHDAIEEAVELEGHEGFAEGSVRVVPLSVEQEFDLYE